MAYKLFSKSAVQSILMAGLSGGKYMGINQKPIIHVPLAFTTQFVYLELLCKGVGNCCRFWTVSVRHGIMVCVSEMKKVVFG